MSNISEVVRFARLRGAGECHDLAMKQNAVYNVMTAKGGVQ